MAKPSDAVVRDICTEVSGLLRKHGFPGGFILIYPQTDGDTQVPTDMIGTVSVEATQSLLLQMAERCKPEHATFTVGLMGGVPPRKDKMQ